MVELEKATRAEIDDELRRREVEEEKTKDVDWQMANLMRLYQDGQIVLIKPYRRIIRADHEHGKHTDMLESGHFFIQVKNPKTEVCKLPRRHL
jgi:hypothetical protein